ncbi:Txe/YoeB family addiction module toxin [Muriicola marianensis]|uniref:Putative mRNA interferase YoeB n=1 Tax=Muriicola marianensis TaxID=1324801 RepID=A0ABQ1R0D1_9FLAO|nr:Txe/YoeB family addiction module toxin [Muriicola marianensis]GGD53657.1 toxin YoeB [Muriicola marianensis]
MIISFTPHGWEDFTYWVDTDEKTVQKIRELISSIRQNPFRGLGKPEPLKYGLKGYWSRRISGEHRLVYKVIGKKNADQQCIIIQCRFHYDEK